MDDFLILLFFIFVVLPSVFQAIVKAFGGGRQPRERQSPAARPPESRPANARPSGATRTRRRPAITISTESAPPLTPEEAIRRLFMGLPPSAERVGQAPSPAAPMSEPVVARRATAPSGRDAGGQETPVRATLERVSESRELREQTARKSQLQKSQLQQGATAAKNKMIEGEQRFRTQALARERRQNERLEAIRQTYRAAGVAAPAASAPPVRPTARLAPVTQLSAVNLRDAVLFHEILQPPLALRRRLGARLSR